MLRVTKTAFAGILLAMLALASPLAAADEPSVVDLMFEKPHLGNLAKGTILGYRFERTATDPLKQGEPFSDDMKLSILEVAKDGTREVAVDMFTGDRARDTQKIPDLTGNPLLVVFLDRCVNNFAIIAGGNRPYLKERFRVALRETASIAPAKVQHDGKTIAAHRITVRPYERDPNVEKMRGYEGSEFTFVVSEAVPGHFVEMHASFENTVKGAGKVTEKLTLKAPGGK